MTESVLAVRDLRVSFGGVPAVQGVDLDLHAGEVLALVGESGSGKTVTALSAMGLLPSNAHVTGQVLVGDRDITALRPEELRSVRGREIGMVFQEPMTALNPVLTVGAQIGEAITNHRATNRRKIPADEVRQQTIALLEAVGVPEPARRVRAYPHQLSGGLRQRVVIAMAIACEPTVVIADEPTTALDVTVQAQILRLLRELRGERGTAILLITHNMGVVADLADRVAVMREGAVVEVGPVGQVLTDPQHEYTAALLGSVPRLGSGSRALPASSDAPVLDLQDVTVEYRTLGRPPARAVDGVTLQVHRGEAVGLVGESGSGKSTIGRCALGLVPATAGRVLLLGADRRRLRGARGRKVRRGVGVVLQDPASALDPRMTVGDSIAEPMVIHGVGSRAERQSRVRTLLDDVHLPAEAQCRYPHELSGGQRQRVGLARALALEPDLVITGEPTSALDVSVQAAVLRLLIELQAQHGFGCLFISHDLAVVESVAHRVAVLLRGRIVEEGPTQEVLHRPQQDYTKLLISSVPVAPTPMTTGG
jgi:peptide/nickel transport system ATP-binding protein